MAMLPPALVLTAGFDPLRQPLEVKRRVGYMPEGDTVIPELSALDLTTLKLRE